VSKVETIISNTDDAISESAVVKATINVINKTNFTLPQTMNAIGKFTNPLAVGFSVHKMYKDPSLYNIAVVTGSVAIIGIASITGVEEWSTAWGATTLISGAVNDVFTNDK